ncbi:acyl-CoA dehydrogenase family protein [Pseudomonas fluorescens]|uniref:Acyl-[acyl-carrier-protein] dehydrogenase MbtN n=1 Tax=Pseudomonas fluorescens TaxID=294 RepID=A0A5E7BZS5_PSEFL|nr:acyl-CoA dehydrogenase family protein [Pseudomonas fluorescens]VVN97666.1 Acyl-CoA dehydrogenase [Pseudomonas fluorescens]
MSYPYDASLFSEEHEAFRTTFRRFLKEEVEPNVDRWTEEHRIPKEFWAKAGKAGVLGMDIPEEYGGPGGDFLYRLVVAQEIGYSVAGATIGPAFIGDGCGEILCRAGTEEQKRKWLPGMVQGLYRAGLAITEPDSGSDVSATRTTAVRDGDEYIIKGAKTFISNFLDADFFMVGCKTNPELGAKGVSVIIVESNRAGFSRGRTLKKMGCNASDTGEIFFDNVRVPVSNLMGGEGRGMSIMLGGVNMDRIMWPIIGHAAATRAFHETLEFVKNRKSFGQPIFEFQNTQFKLAEIKTELTIAQAFLDKMIRDYKAKGELDMMQCAMAKMWYGDMEGRIIDQCVQLHGGSGYMDEYVVSRLYTAARLHRIFAGTAEIMRVLVARSL